MPARNATDEEPKPGWDVGEEIAVRVVVWQKAALKSTRNKHPLGEVLRWHKTSPPRKRSRLRRRTRSRSERSCWRGSRRSRQAQAEVKASRAASQRRRSLLRSPTTARDTAGPGVQLRGGNRQIRTTVPALARGVTPVIAWSRPGQRCPRLSARRSWPYSGQPSEPAGGPCTLGPQSLRNRASYSSRFYVEKESLAVISVHDDSLSGVIGDVWHDSHKTV